MEAVANTPVQTASTRGAALVRHLAAGALCLALLASALVMYTRGNDFPIDYHPDESGKVKQILDDTRNYRHPQLLLEATELAVAARGTPKGEIAVVRVGRAVSALFGALAVVALALAGYRIAGLAGLVICGLSVLLCPSLLLYSHYMKEDAALAMGFAMTVLAGVMVWTAAGWVRRGVAILLLGAACGVAVSGKYAGIYALAASVPLVLLAPPRWNWWQLLRPLLLVIGFVPVTASINHRAMADYDSFAEGLRSEEQHSITAHLGITMDRPNTFFIRALGQECMPQVLVGAGLYIVLAAVAWRRTAGWEWFVILFTAGYLAALSWTVLPFHRYLLPVVMLSHFMMGLGVLRTGELIVRRLRWTAPGAAPMAVLKFPAASAVLPALAIAAIAPLGMRSADFIDQFRNDSRASLRAWVTANLPEGTSIAEDLYAGLSGLPRREDWWRPHPTKMQVRGERAAPELGSLSYLEATGVQYVAVADFSYDRFFDPQVKGAEGRTDHFRMYRQWYEDLFAHYPLVWQSTPAHPTYGFTNPTIRLYRLTRDGK